MSKVSQKQASKENFPTKTFQQALIQTKKIKGNLKSFLQQYSKNNMYLSIYFSLWIYESFSNLVKNLNDPSVEPLIKMNSIFAVKCILDSCQYVPIAFIEAYILPIIKSAALTDTESPQDQRGQNYFFNPNNDQEIKNYGFHYVKISTQILKALSVIKPKRLHYAEQTLDSSEFTLAIEEVQSKLKKPIVDLSYFAKASPDSLRTLYVKNISEFEQKSQNYEEFIESKFLTQFKAGFKIQQIDIRALITLCDDFIIESILQTSGNIILSAKSCNTIRTALMIVNSVVLSGSVHACTFLYDNKAIKYLVKEAINIQNPTYKLERGQNYLMDKKGTSQQRSLLYTEFFKCLELWANTFPQKSLKNPAQPSKVAKYFKTLKDSYGYQFPRQLAIQNQIEQANQNYEKNEDKNRKLIKQIQAQIEGQLDDSIITQRVPPKEQIPSLKQLQNPTKQIKGQAQQNNAKLILDNTSIKTPLPLSFRNGLENLSNQLNVLSKDERSLPQNINKIQKDIEGLYNHMQSNEVNSEEFKKFESLMEQYEKIDQYYESYKTGKINFDQFKQRVHKVCPANTSKPKDQTKITISQPRPFDPSHFSKNEKIENIPSSKSIHKQETPNNSIKQQQKPQIVVYVPTNIPDLSKEGPSMTYSITKKLQIKNNSGSNTPLRNLEESREHFERSNMNDSILSDKEQSQRYDSSIKNPYAQQPFTTPVANSNQYENNQVNSNNLDKQQRILQQQRQSQGYRKFSNKPQSQQKISDIGPVTYSNSIQQNQRTSPIKNKDQGYPIHNESIKSESSRVEKFDILEDDGFIEGPALNPLTSSYHEFSQHANQTKTFKDAISNGNLMLRSNRRQNLFKLESQSNSLIRPVSTNTKKSRIESKINIPQLLDERSNKHAIEMRLLEQNKDKKIRELSHQLQYVERQKSHLSEELRIKQQEIRSYKANSEIDGDRSKTDQYSIVDDQNYLMKKFAATNNFNPKRLGQSMRSQSRILTAGQIINTKIYASCFTNIASERQRKIHMKNKELLFKDNYLQIGYMGHLGNNGYQITCFFTPEADFTLQDLQIDAIQNLKVSHDLPDNLSIAKRRQHRAHFYVDILSIPYSIPTVNLIYRIDNQTRRTQFLLPCAFHKFFKFDPINDNALQRELESNGSVRGEEIPYSRKILKHIDVLLDLLPQISKINQGQPNHLGQKCFGGSAINKETRIPIKISIKQNQFLYIQASQPKDQNTKKITSFLIATLNHFLMKDIAWN